MGIERYKILMFSAFYPPHLGGVERYVQQLSKALINRGDEVTVVTSKLRNERVPDGSASLNSEEPNVIFLPSVSLFDDRMPLLLYGGEFARKYKELLIGDYDAIVINTRYYPLSVLAAHVAKKKRLRPIVIDHSSGYISNEIGLAGCVLRSYERFMTKLIGFVDPIYCSVSKGGFDWLTRLGLRPEAVISNSIDARSFRRLASSRDWRSELGSSESTMIIVYSGRLIPEKGLPKLLEALASRGLAQADICLAIAGAGPLENELSKTKDSRVRYLGRLSRPDLSALLRDSDCLCLPTDYPEGLPTVLLEAASQRCAIIVSDCAGAREVVPNESCGIVLDENTPLAIASAIQTLYHNRCLLKGFGESVCDNTERRLSWAAAAEALQNEFR